MGDPECAWVLHGVECVAISANIYRREYLTQDKEKCSTQVIEKPTTTPQPLLQRKMECLCESPTQVPCTTEVFQREVVTSTAEFLNPWAWFLFCIGLASGALLNLILTRSK
ncbi:hypothetical protein OSTOST_23311 [Ostertagia ostertagi]